MPHKDMKPYTEISKGLTIDDTAAAIDMTCACMKNTGGRPCTYANSEAGLNTFIENAKGYFTYVQSANSKLEEKQQLIPDVEGLTLYLGIDRSTLCRYHARGGEWEKTIDYIKNAIGYSKKQLALRGKIPTVLAIFDLANNHNYHNVNEFHLSTDDNNTKSAADNDTTLEERIAEMGLIWDEERKEYIPDE